MSSDFQVFYPTLNAETMDRCSLEEIEEMLEHSLAALLSFDASDAEQTMSEEEESIVLEIKQLELYEATLRNELEGIDDMYHGGDHSVDSDEMALSTWDPSSPRKPLVDTLDTADMIVCEKATPSSPSSCDVPSLAPISPASSAQSSPASSPRSSPARTERLEDPRLDKFSSLVHGKLKSDVLKSGRPNCKPNRTKTEKTQFAETSERQEGMGVGSTEIEQTVLTKMARFLFGS